MRKNNMLVYYLTQFQELRLRTSVILRNNIVSAGLKLIS